MADGSGPRSGKNAPKKASSKKGKAKMSEAAWDRLSSRQKERDYGGSRFESTGSRSTAKEAGHEAKGSERGFRDRGPRG